MIGGNLWKGLLGAYRTPSAATLAQRELEQARRDLLECHTHSEYYAAMVQVNRQRIARLTVTINEFNKAPTND